MTIDTAPKAVLGQVDGSSPPDVPLQDPLKADFRVFLTALWAFLGLPKPTPLQLDMAYYLQHGPQRSIIQAFRGAAKSWITGAYVLWCLYRDPVNEKIMVVSASGNRSAKFTNWCLDIIRRWDVLAGLRPMPDQRQSSLGFDVAPAAEKPDQQPSMEAKGITGQIAGGRATKIVADDVEIPRNSDTETKREKLREQVREFDAVIKPGGRIVYLGTPQSSSSIYPTLETRGYETRIWPILFPSTDKLESIWGAKLAPSIVSAINRRPELAGKSVEPSRFTSEDIAARLLSYGTLGFSLQFQLDTTAGDNNRFPLKLNDLVVMDCADPDEGPEKVVWAGSKEYRDDIEHYGQEGDRLHKPMKVSEEFVKWQFTVMYVDPSGKGTDETAYAIVRFLNGRLFLTRFGGIQGGYGEPVLKKLGEIAKREKVNHIMVEENFGQGMFMQLLTPHVDCEIEGDRVTTQKERRIIDTLEPIISSHRLVVDRSTLERDYSVFATDMDEDSRELEVAAEAKSYYSFTYQLAHITFDRNCLTHDDRLDAVAGAVRFFVDRLDADTGELEIASADQRANEDLEGFLNPIKQGGRQVHTADYPTSHNVLSERN